MRRILLPLLFLMFAAFSFGQNQLKVINASNQKPIANASVFCDDDLIGKTNSEGELSFKTKCKRIDILASNFENAELEVEKEMQVVLQPTADKIQNIERVVILDNSDPKALRILDEVNKRFKENSPKSLDSYQFKSYSKYSMDLDQDSISTYRDFMVRREDSLSQINSREALHQKEKEKKDSLIGEDFFNTARDSQFFLWEKVSDHQFSKKYGDKTVIIDNRMSGFQNPIYEFLAFNVSNLDKIPRQIRPENRDKYRFYLSDTITVDNRKTFVVKFKEINDKQRQNPKKYTGKIYIDAENYALKEIESASKKKNEGTVSSVWKMMGGKWFLDREDMKLRMGDQSFDVAKKDSVSKNDTEKYVQKTFGNYLYVKNRYFDFEINEPAKSEDFKGYSLEMKNSDGSLLSQYRTDSLSSREANTYQAIDSLVQKHDFDKKVNSLVNLLRGNVRYKIFDFDMTRLIDWNKYEGVRLGMGVKLNEKFSTTFSPDAYFGYGFKDHTWKYGFGLDTKLSQKRTSIFRVDFSDDVYAAGRFNSTFWSSLMKINDLSLDAYNDKFYRSKQVGASYWYDLSNSLSLKLGLRREWQNAEFDYQYKNFDNKFDNMSTTLSLKYSPRDKNIMTPSGKYTYERNFPQFFVNAEFGNRWLGGELNYQRLDALAIHQFKNKLGTTNIKLFGGISSGEAPIWKQFNLSGQVSTKSDWLSHINFPSNLGFATMPAGVFYADKFVSLQVNQRLPFKFKTLGKRFSSVELAYKSAVGGFKNPQDHQFDFQVLDHNYQEVGFMWNQFLGTRYGIGLSYRLGHYQTSDFVDNFGIQIKLLDF